MLCGGFPPQIDGIGDYTWHLGRELARLGHPIQVLTSRIFGDKQNTLPAITPPSPGSGVTVSRCFDPHRPATLRGLQDHLAHDLDWLVLQYNPFGFGPRGFTPWLITALREIRRRMGLAVMFHETFVPPWPWRFAIMRLWQLPQFWALTHLAHTIFVSSERWITQVHAFKRQASCIHLPVGSNLPRCPSPKAEARRRLGIAPDTTVLGAFGSAHVTKMPHLIGVAARAVKTHFPNTMVLSIGRGGPTLRLACAGVEFRDEGVRSPDEAALCIRAMDVMLAPFVDGLATRRGSAIAALQQGVPVCSTVTPWTDRLLVEPPWTGIRLCPPDEPETYAENAVGLVVDPPSGEEIRRRHDKVFGWPKIAQRLLESLGVTG